jgi:hypothetical protein
MAFTQFNTVEDILKDMAKSCRSQAAMAGVMDLLGEVMSKSDAPEIKAKLAEVGDIKKRVELFTEAADVLESLVMERQLDAVRGDPMRKLEPIITPPPKQ